MQLFHHEEVRQLVKSKKVQVVTLPLMRRHMFAVHFLLHKSSILADVALFVFDVQIYFQE